MWYGLSMDLTTTTIPVAAVTAVSGRPCPDLVLTWRHITCPPDEVDPNYADQAWFATVTGPEPIRQIEVAIHDHSAFGVPEFSWEVDGCSEWSLPAVTESGLGDQASPYQRSGAHGSCPLDGVHLHVPWTWSDPNQISAASRSADGRIESVDACLAAIVPLVQEAVARWWEMFQD